MTYQSTVLPLDQPGSLKVPLRYILTEEIKQIETGIRSIKIWYRAGQQLATDHEAELGRYD